MENLIKAEKHQRNKYHQNFTDFFSGVNVGSLMLEFLL